MRTLGYMPTEMELIEVSQHVKMRSQCLSPHAPRMALGVQHGVMGDREMTVSRAI